MADIADAQANINDVEVDADAALSEALFEKIGGAINYLNTTTDTHTTQITALQTETANASTFSGSTTSSTGTLKSATITTAGTNVMVFVAGIFQMSGAGETATIQIQRNGSSIYSLSVTSSAALPAYSFLDTGATDATSTTYRIEITAISGTLTYSNAYIGCADLK